MDLDEGFELFETTFVIFFDALGTENRSIAVSQLSAVRMCLSSILTVHLINYSIQLRLGDALICLPLIERRLGKTAETGYSALPT